MSAREFTLDLPLDRPRSGRSAALRTSAVDLGPGLADGGASADDVVLAAFAVVLARYTGLSSFSISTGVQRPEGTLSGVVDLPLDVSGEPSFAELVSRVGTLATTYADDHNGAGGAQLFFAQGSVTPEVEKTSRELGIRFDRIGGELAVDVEYDANLFDAATAERVAGHLRTLLAAAAEAPDATIWSLRLLTEPEETQILDEWNRTEVPYPDRCLHELISEQAAKTPRRPAVTGAGGTLTYEELETQSNQLAHHLRGLGVGPETFVGLILERTPRLLVALLGILKAGGAYVPVDPGYPTERQRLMLEDAGVRVIVTEEALLHAQPKVDATLVCLGRDWPEIERLPEEPPDVAHSPSQLANVIYTSGSTGRPKGVALEHRGFVNLLTHVQRELDFGADDVFLALTTLSFDIAGTELYVPLLAGGRVVLGGDGAAGDPRWISMLIDRYAATFIQSTPTGWQMLVDSGWSGRPGLTGLTAGEALAPSLADALLSRRLTLWNLYGPSETTIYSTGTKIEPGRPITIGRAIANTCLYVLDGHMQPVPVGVAGELYIGGDGLARGYLGQPELTDERFVPSPFAGGSRLYKTGDLVRYRHDGNLEYLGRIDHQVKVRGFRIELGEVEAAFMRHPSVSAVVVVKDETRTGDARLVAYVQAGEPCSDKELRGFVGETLAPYMVPSRVITLEAFPLTPNGKIDRKALPAPETVAQERENDYVAPRTELEKTLAATWEGVIGIRPIGVTDNFFDLGASSIVAARLLAMIEKTQGSKLPLGLLFQAPTIAQLATSLEDGTDERRWTSLVPIQPEGTELPIFCVHGGAGTILHLEPLARRLAPDRPFYGLQAQGLYGGAPPLTTVEDQSAHYISELREIQPHGPYYLAGYCYGALVAYDMAQRLLRDGEEVRLLAFFNGPSPTYIHSHSAGAAHATAPATRSTRDKAVRALRNPRRIVERVRWYGLRTRWAAERHVSKLYVKRRWALPESLRDNFFLMIHYRAERAYTAQPYPGEMLNFYGAGLYTDDPLLGWGDFGNTLAFSVPGEHPDNRTAMREPHSGFIAARLREYLEEEAPAYAESERTGVAAS